MGLPLPQYTAFLFPLVIVVAIGWHVRWTRLAYVAAPVPAALGLELTLSGLVYGDLMLLSGQHGRIGGGPLRAAAHQSGIGAVPTKPPGASPGRPPKRH